ncbi:MAG: sugar transferase [Planctomycetota bacterium]|jgi:lipopolysaccharide/colanic/teichoic acid biosynthesis glycosyltransferase
MDNRISNQRYSPYLDSSAKRCLDIIVCLILLLPAVLMLLVILPVALIVDGRPALFFQRRVGRGGKEFLMPKIRTLKKHAHPNKPACSYDTEAFTTKTGSLLRRHRLDELPQIFSVLAGKMSLVGPRPELPDVVKNYTAKEFKRLCARPGLTGIWQIKASRNQPIHKNIRYDFYYLRKASLRLDIRILAETIPFVLRAGSKIFHEKNHLYTYNLPVPE